MPIRTAVDKGTFLMALLVGAGVLALWVDVRLGERSPQSLLVVLLHGGASLAVVHFMGALAPRVIDPASLPRTMLALFAIVLPAWMYVFLASLWVLKLLRGAMPR